MVINIIIIITTTTTTTTTTSAAAAAAATTIMMFQRNYLFLFQCPSQLQTDHQIHHPAQLTAPQQRSMLSGVLQGGGR